MIKLYYLPILDGVNTVHFGTTTSRNNFFSYPRATIDTGFYPPKFKDTIELEVSILTVVNYIEIIFSDFSYYYFINKIEYINENLTRYYIQMDTIMTFMENSTSPVAITEAIIKRYTIKRWNQDGTINRDYIRENIRKGDYMNKSLTRLVNDEFGWLIVEYMTDSIYPLAINSKYRFVNTKSGVEEYVMPYKYNEEVGVRNTTASYTGLLAIPYPKLQYRNYKYAVKDTPQESAIDPPLTTEYISALLDLPFITSVRYFDYDIFQGIIRYDDDNTNRIIKFKNTNNGANYSMICPAELQYYNDDDPSVPYWQNKLPLFMLATGYIPGNLGKPVKMIPLEDYTTITFGFVKNTLNTSLFSYTYCPQLLDENYIKFYAGERVMYTSYPLHCLVSPSVALHYVTDVVTGNRTYYLNEYYTAVGQFYDDYQTLITVATIEELPLFNDAWKTYISQNQATLTRGLALATQKSFLDVGEGAMASIVVNPISGATKGANAIISPLVYAEKYSINKENLEYTPDTTRQGNTVTSDIKGDSLAIVSSIAYCDDIEACARYFEQNGYRIDKYTTTFPYASRSRSRYDYIEADVLYISISPNNICVVDNDIINDIKARFARGVRVWYTGFQNIQGTLGSYYYDNIEI